MIINSNIERKNRWGKSNKNLQKITKEAKTNKREKHRKKGKQ